MICCDTCPYTPTCEEMGDFMDQIGLRPEWGDQIVDLDGDD